MRYNYSPFKGNHFACFIFCVMFLIACLKKPTPTDKPADAADSRGEAHTPDTFEFAAVNGRELTLHETESFKISFLGGDLYGLNLHADEETDFFRIRICQNEQNEQNEQTSCLQEDWFSSRYYLQPLHTGPAEISIHPCVHTYKAEDPLQSCGQPQSLSLNIEQTIRIDDPSWFYLDTLRLLNTQVGNEAGAIVLAANLGLRDLQSQGCNAYRSSTVYQAISGLATGGPGIVVEFLEEGLATEDIFAQFKPNALNLAGEAEPQTFLRLDTNTSLSSPAYPDFAGSYQYALSPAVSFTTETDALNSPSREVITAKKWQAHDLVYSSTTLDSLTAQAQVSWREGKNTATSSRPKVNPYRELMIRAKYQASRDSLTRFNLSLPQQLQNEVNLKVDSNDLDQASELIREHIRAVGKIRRRMPPVDPTSPTSIYRASEVANLYQRGLLAEANARIDTFEQEDLQKATAARLKAENDAKLPTAKDIQTRVNTAIAVEKQAKANISDLEKSLSREIYELELESERSSIDAKLRSIDELSSKLYEMNAKHHQGAAKMEQLLENAIRGIDNFDVSPTSTGTKAQLQKRRQAYVTQTDRWKKSRLQIEAANEELISYYQNKKTSIANKLNEMKALTRLESIDEARFGHLRAAIATDLVELKNQATRYGESIAKEATQREEIQKKWQAQIDAYRQVTGQAPSARRVSTSTKPVGPDTVHQSPATGKTKSPSRVRKFITRIRGGYRLTAGELSEQDVLRSCPTLISYENELKSRLQILQGTYQHLLSSEEALVQTVAESIDPEAAN